jgi:hypothetical protein
LILFLDIDGVLHPLNREHGVFSCEGHLARVLDDFPAVEIVISSAWRLEYELKILRTFFLTNLRNRIIAVTPALELPDDADIMESRHREIQSYLSGRSLTWLALDDDARLFPSDCAQLVLCEDGFGEIEERVLRDKLKCRS